jgi:hypothetical protein
MVRASLVSRGLAMDAFRSCVMSTRRSGGAMHRTAQDGKRCAA